MIEIPLTRGMFAIIDDEDFELVSQYKWCVRDSGSKFYAGTRYNNKIIFMHRLIMNFPKEIDHRDGDGLNNIRSNLRICTTSQNRANYFKLRGNRNYSSQFKGVSWHRNGKFWDARICFNKQLIRLGRFKNEIDAAKAYNIAAKKYFGRFARVNELQASRD